MHITRFGLENFKIPSSAKVNTCPNAEKVTTEQKAPRNEFRLNATGGAS